MAYKYLSSVLLRSILLFAHTAHFSKSETIIRQISDVPATYLILGYKPTYVSCLMKHGKNGHVLPRAYIKEPAVILERASERVCVQVHMK